LRLTGCNLRCAWCDTAYAFYGGTKRSIDDVLTEARKPAGTNACGTDNISLVEITGGGSWRAQPR